MVIYIWRTGSEILLRTQDYYVSQLEFVSQPLLLHILTS